MALLPDLATHVLVTAVAEGHEERARAALALGGDPRVTVTSAYNDSVSWCLLTLAANKGHAHLLPLLLGAGLGLEGAGFRAWPPLVLAAATGHARVVEALLAAGADPLATNREGRTALHCAARWGWERCVAALTGFTPTVVRDCGGWNPVHHASAGGHVRVVEQLVAAGWSLHALATRGESPLHCAARSGHLVMVQHLVRRGRLSPFLPDIQGHTPLDVAVKQGHHEIECWLVKQSRGLRGDPARPLRLMRAQRALEEDSHSVALSFIRDGNMSGLGLIPKMLDGHHTDEEGRTLLHHAAQLGRLRAVEGLLARGVHPHVLTHTGLTPLDLARREGHHQVIQVLQDHKCVQVQGSPEERYNKLLTVISTSDDVSEVSRLLCGGAPLEPVGVYPHPALQQALTNDRPKIVRLLLAAGAALTSSLDGLNLLQQTWASPNVTSKVHVSLLEAYSHRLEEERRRLRRCSAELCEGVGLIRASLDGNTPWDACWPRGRNEVQLSSLMEKAARANCPLAVSFLQKAGGWPFFSGHSGSSPLHAALEAGHTGLAEAMVRDLTGSLYTPDAHGRLPRDMTPQPLRRLLEQRVYEKERRRLEALEAHEKDNYEKQKVEAVMALQEDLFTRYTKGGTDRGFPVAGSHALLVASRSGLLQLAHLLLRVAGLPADTVLDITCGTTALHQAASYGKSGMVSLLLSAGADPLRTDRYGQTPLLLAAMFGHRNTYRFLAQLGTGADPSCRAGTTAAQTLHNYARYLQLYAKYGDAARASLTPLDRHDASQVTNIILRGIDPQELVREARRVTVDFRKGEARKVRGAVMRELDTLIGRVAAADPIYKGKLRLVGSSWDGSKLYAPDEYDVNIVIQASNTLVQVEEETDMAVQHKGHKLKITVSSDDPRLKGSRLMGDLHGAVERCLSVHLLQDKRLSIVPPGLTRTLVGVALSLAWQGEQFPLLLVGVDLVPVLEFPWHERINRPTLTPKSAATMHVSNTADGCWRCSFAQTEAKVLSRLFPEERLVLLVAKTLLSCLKAEPWMPRDLKSFCTWWSGRPWNIPAPGGFCLKSCFLRQLEQKRRTGARWRERDTLREVAAIFRGMCSVTDNVEEHLLPHKNFAYFGGDCEGPKQGDGAPLIADFLLNSQACAAEQRRGGNGASYSDRRRSL